jgi:histidinol-phosphate aminotransferase
VASFKELLSRILDHMERIMNNFAEAINPRIFQIPDYDQGHVTKCWKNKNMHRLMSNESCYHPLPPVVDAIKNIAEDSNYYAEDPTYAYELRSQLADYASVKLENITLGNGSIELLDILFQVLLSEPGKDQCLLPQPDYSAYIPRLTFFDWDYMEISYGEDIRQVVPQILENITQRTKFIIFSRPNNPTGTMILKPDIKRLLETGLFIVVDEAYIELAGDNSSVSSWVRDWDNLVVTRTFSKGFCLAGIRLGYMIAQPEIIKYINRSRHIFNVNIAAMAAGKATMNLLDEYKKRFAKVANIRDQTLKSIGKLPGLSVTKSHGNFILVNTSETGLPASKFVEVLLDNDYFVRDFSNKPGLKPNSYFRISVGKQDEMAELVAILADFVS